ncbi:dnaJ homolog subfamily C member 28-like [Actinia tenebrosa]|uniref:DnaJ homolog subfamily C member 28-like n=1 Tax=Actinia tenebrosa TaxID=6105 RepID=A0A6P8HK82_ACTTE|nr:dnaJ homolog subfamily C member 28-like [Actinia tenebrosa]
MATAAGTTLPLLRILTRKSQSFWGLNSFRRHLHCSVTLLSEKSKLTIRECYKLLGLSEEDTTETEVRAAYFKLAKQYHPDSGQSKADPEKFARIEQAYKVVLKHLSQKHVEEEEGDDEEDKFDIRHTAPQHRQYLEYGGFGSGTPSTREKQYRNHRFEQAIEGVFSHKTKQHGAEETSIAKAEKKAIRKNKISGAIERMVEDLIQEAMSKGEFQNLPGSGKPFTKDPLRDPYMDSGTHRLNQILLDSGYVPDWIALEKEIREDYATLKNKIRIKREQLGPMPFTKEDHQKWSNFEKGLTQKVQLIDRKIDKLNLIVPVLNRQRMHINLQKIINKALMDYGYGSPELFSPKDNSVAKENIQRFYLDINIRNSLTVVFRDYIGPVMLWTIFYLDSLLRNLKAKYVNKNQ